MERTELLKERKDSSFEKSQQKLKPQQAKGNENGILIFSTGQKKPEKRKREKNEYGSNQEEDQGEILMKAQNKKTAEKYLGLTGEETGVV